MTLPVVKKKRNTENTEELPSEALVSLDPEVRTFLTGYNPTDLKCLEIGKRECTLRKLDGGLRKSINLQCTLRDRAAEAGKLEEAENRRSESQN